MYTDRVTTTLRAVVTFHAIKNADEVLRMIPGFYAVTAGLLLAMARGWLWLGKRMRAPGDRQIAHQFFLGLVGLSLSMAELEYAADFDLRRGSQSHSTEPSTITPTRKPGNAARRAAHIRPASSARWRRRNPDSRPHRRPAFGAENPHRWRRL